MAKKKVLAEAKAALKKKVEKKEETVSLLVTTEHIGCLLGEIDKLNKRIDSIVEAIDKCKRVKGL